LVRGGRLISAGSIEGVRRGARLVAACSLALALGIAGCRDGAVLAPAASDPGGPMRPLDGTPAISGPVPNVQVCSAGAGGTFTVSNDDHSGPPVIGIVTVAAGACRQVATAGGAAAVVKVTESSVPGVHLDSIVKDSLTWSTADSTRLARRTGTATDSVFLSGSAPAVGGVLTFYHTAPTTTITVCARGLGATFTLIGATSPSVALGANQCVGVATHAAGTPTVAVQATENVPPGAALDSIVVTSGPGRTKITGRTWATALATDANGATMTFYNRAVPQTFITVCMRGASATVRVSGGANVSPFILDGRCQVVATHTPGAPTLTVQAQELVPNGFALDSIVTVSPAGHGAATGRTAVSASANDVGGATLTFYQHAIPPTTITLCSNGAAASFALAGASVTSLTLNGGQCRVVATHAGGVAPLSVLATEHIPAGTVLDSIVTVGVNGRVKLVGPPAAAAIANNQGGSIITFYNRAIPSTTVTVCLTGPAATWNVSGGVITRLSLTNGQCHVVGTHVGGTVPLNVQAAENVPPGVVVDSIVVTGPVGRTKLVGRVAASATANDIGSAAMRFYNR
jgi:hypothetical protein